MLPPIQASMSTTVQNRVPQRQDQGHQSRGGQRQNQDGRMEQDQVSVSGNPRVNVLNLSGPERMSVDLTRFSQAIERALNLPLLPGEAPDMHAYRLAETVLALNPGAFMAVERQLAVILQGLPLQLVAMALRYPGGAEAARVAAFLERNDQKGDLAMQAVLASYQQNDVSDEDELLLSYTRSSGPEIEINGTVLPLKHELSLFQAAQSAASRAGIALPYIGYPIEDPAEDQDEEKAAHGHSDRDEQETRDEHGEDTADAEEGQEPAGILEANAAGDDAMAAQEASAEPVIDDQAYNYYQRLSGDL